MATIPLVHNQECYAEINAIVPTLHVAFIPSRERTTIRVLIWESCQYCSASVSYVDGREPERRFHRTWKARVATWLATWEHRNGLWDGPTEGR